MPGESIIYLRLLILTSLIINRVSLETISFSREIIFIDYLSFSLVFLTILIFIFLPFINLFLIFRFLKIKNITRFSLQLILISIFLTCKSIIFYILFELSLIPIFLIIIGWGYQIERLRAGTALIIYTVTASLPLLFMVLWLMWKTDIFSLPFMIENSVLTNPIGILSLIIIITRFLVKFPIYLGHLWLPKAHVEAPATGSIVLAAILLKLGGYGLIRFSYLISYNINLLLLISVAFWGGVVRRLICLQSLDLKIVVAYSSVAHMAIVIAAVLSMTRLGLTGGIIIIVAHGLSSSGLFFVVGTFSKYSNSRRLLMNKGLLISNPVVSAIWFLILIIGIGIPPSLNFFSEVLSIISICSDFYWRAISASLLIFFAGCYRLILYRVVSHSVSVFTPPKKSNYLISEKLTGLSHAFWAFWLILFIMILE